MPEEIEIETRDLQESIDEMREEHKEMQEEAGRNEWVRWISLSTALFAVVAAVAALQAGTLSNHSLAKMSDAVMQQALASDEWEQFQAKSIKGVIAEQAAASLAANPSTVQASRDWKARSQRYDSEKADLETKARAFEAKRDLDDEEADELMEHHHIFAYCVTFTQVAIALSAIAALTRRKPLWFGSMLVGVCGAILFINGFASQTQTHIAREHPATLREHPAPHEPDATRTPAGQPAKHE